jgi:hypothetical protein
MRSADRGDACTVVEPITSAQVSPPALLIVSSSGI